MPDNINKLGNFRFFFSTKEHGNMSFSHGQRNEVISQREAYLTENEIDPKKVVFVQPCHTGSMTVVGSNGSSFEFSEFHRDPTVACDFPGYLSGSDGIVTFDETIYIALLTGDCIPLLVVHKESGLHGILHVGLLGLLNGIIFTLSKILETFSIPPSEVEFVIGPGISSANYDLAKSGLWPIISSQIKERSLWVEKFMVRGENFIMMSISDALKFQLDQIGINIKNVQSFGGCTADPASRFFSNYRAKRSGMPNGRFITIIGK